jgi:hypothetical protein
MAFPVMLRGARRGDLPSRFLHAQFSFFGGVFGP